MTEILSGERIKAWEEAAKQGMYFFAEEMQRALNTIKLQRQQLAEQERKVWNEAKCKHCYREEKLCRCGYKPSQARKRGEW